MESFEQFNCNHINLELARQTTTRKKTANKYIFVFKMLISSFVRPIYNGFHFSTSPFWSNKNSPRIQKRYMSIDPPGVVTPIGQATTEAR
jgi:hypothetical protein